MRLNKQLLIAFLTLWILILFPLQIIAGDKFGNKINNKLFVNRSLLSKGNTARLKHVLARARRGEGIVIGVIGGSITRGNRAKTVKDRWGNRVSQWWHETFPQSNVKFINAGIGGTGSNFGAHRVQRDLLKYRPDFIVAEFAVNDSNTKLSAETLEGMTRQILKGSNSPALLLLFMTYKNGNNAQEWHSKVGRHYGLPMISYRDAILPEISEGRLNWTDISPDIVHPNSRGHKYCAEFINAFLSSILADMPDDNNLPEINEIPEPLISDTYEYTAIYHNSDIVPVINSGWFNSRGGWKASAPGSEIVFEVTGKTVSIMYYIINGNMGIAEASVDDNPPVRLDGWWNGSFVRTQLNIVARDLKQGRHILRIKLLKDNTGDSKGNNFEISAIMTAGM